MKKLGWIKRIIDFAAIFSILGILLYRIELLRGVCKKICQYVVDWYIPVELADIVKAYLWMESIFRACIFVFIIVSFIIWIVKSVWDNWLKKQKGKNRFEESILRYLHDSSIPQCFLVTGKWGSGKTYEVQEFFDKYYKFSKTKVYRVSCFGLNTRKDLVEEINNVIEQEDHSLYSLSIQAFQYLPVIGEPIGKFFKKSYHYDSIKKDSVFIFDDFERITSRTNRNDSSQHLYKTSPFLLSKGGRKRATEDEFKQIKQEFDEIESGFSKVDNFLMGSLERTDFDKYIAIIGLINEIVETYGMKVIILCNTEILGERFTHDFLRSKLNCMEYRKTISSSARKSMIDMIMKNKTFDDEKKQEMMKAYMEALEKNIDWTVLDGVFDDLRLFGGLLEAFVVSASLFSKETLTMDFMNSLFNSIMVVHQLFYKNAIAYLDYFETGANMEFLVKTFYKESFNPVRINHNAEEIKWIDISISGYWILNMSSPKNMTETERMWKAYKYYKEEEELYKDYKSFLNMKEYKFVHLLYYQRTSNKDEWIFKLYIDEALKSYNLNDDKDIQSILDMMAIVFQNSRYQNQKFFLSIFEKLGQDKKSDKIEGNTYVHEMYQNYLKDGTIF